MSNLQDLRDALAWAKSGYEVCYQIGKHITVLAEAARQVANPDYEFAAWADLSEGDRANRIKQAKIDVDAALGDE